MGYSEENKAAVSVIVSVYNVEAYLDDCLSSLERQTFKDIEVILVDDGSTDESQAIAQKYVDKNSSFRLIKRENGGASAARNTGLNQASGKYVYFLDGDDYLVDSAIEELFYKAEKEQLDVIKFGAYTFTEPSNELTWTSDEYMYAGEYPDIYSGVELLTKVIPYGDARFSSCCLLFSRREIIEENNLRFYEGITYEDNLFHWQLLVLSQRTTVMNKPLYCRRYRAGSVTQAIDYPKKFRALATCAKEADKYLNSHGELRATGIDWYVVAFIEMSFDAWFYMKPIDRKSKEIKNYYKSECIILRKYHYGKKIANLLYVIHPWVYGVCSWGVKKVRVILNKVQREG